MTAEGEGWDGEPRKATAGGTQESGANGRLGDAMSGGGDPRKSPSATAENG